jgi:hypothetical protein
MAQILTFAREGSKWYRVLRHYKGFGTARFPPQQPLAGTQLSRAARTQVQVVSRPQRNTAC